MLRSGRLSLIRIAKYTTIDAKNDETTVLRNTCIWGFEKGLL